MAYRLLILAALVSCAVAAHRADCPRGHSDFTPRQWKFTPDSVTTWGALCPFYSTCNTGMRQSPINIPAGAPTTQHLQVSYGRTEINVVRVDQVIAMPALGTHKAMFGGAEWTLESIEFKQPAEHSLAGRRPSFELQLFHSRADPMRPTEKLYLGLAILFDQADCDNKALDAIWPMLPRINTCRCGNGRTEKFLFGTTSIFEEECDSGIMNNNSRDSSCRETCKLPRCGDFVRDAMCGEECDEGPVVIDRPNRCRANCTLPRCGDRIVDNLQGEQCDHGIGRREEYRDLNEPFGGCDPLCKFMCGNGRIDPYLNTSIQEECDFGAANSNASDAPCRPDCRFPRCGDGFVNGNEQCDNGINNATSPNCRTGCVLGTCGDGIQDGGLGEDCDVGNGAGSWNATGTVNSTIYVPGQAHVSSCNWRTCRKWCGDGIVTNEPNAVYTEQCDRGSANSNTQPDGCRLTCQNAYCGDGVADPGRGEQCDPGHLVLPAGSELLRQGLVMCNRNCTWRCGNHFVDANDVQDGIPAEECDNGPLVTPVGVPGTNPGIFRPNGNSNNRSDACRENCKLPVCGDGVVDPLFGEMCDWGVGANVTVRTNATAGNSNTAKDACRLNCKTPCCGDGVTDTGEECDHGLTASNFTGENHQGGNAAANNYGCSSDCRLLCGDGVRGSWFQGITRGEQCDDGQLNSDATADKCRTGCKIHFCGDGFTDFDEECDDFTANARCTSDCRRTFCGDGVIQRTLGEECDAGAANSYSTANTQGCSPICTLNRCGLSENFRGSALSVELYDLLWGNERDTGNFRPSSPGRFHYYKGSWTRPPCTENVEWLVANSLQKIGRNQLLFFQRAIGMNSRPQQDNTARVVSSAYDDTVPRQVAVCGNGIKEGFEQCDMGRWNSDTIPNRCRMTGCRAPSCGDRVIDQGEECDGESWCSATCKRATSFPIVANPLNVRGARVTDYNDDMHCKFWTYDLSHLWGDLTTCSACHGTRQSPIAIPTNCPGTNRRALSLNHPSNVQYVNTPAVMFNTGQNILFPVYNGGTFSFNGKTYKLTRMEFHQPSEHVIGDKRFDLELQLYHTAQNPGVNEQAALAILFEKGDLANAFLDKFWNQLPPVSACSCGNGIKEDVYYMPDGRIVKEQCDAGNNNSDTIPNRCRNNCQLPKCGDFVADTNEACDWGTANSFLPSYCRPDCTTPFCGDGIKDNEEQCDDGNGNNIDACDNNCRLTCGNGIKEGDEECDNGPLNSNTKANACRLNCRNPRCGDNVVDVGEACDEASTSNVSNRCRTDCTMPFCGDRIVDPQNDEQCDGTADCTNNTLIAACFNDPNGVLICSKPCQRLCGNGVVDFGEQCDDGAANSNTNANACRTNCRRPTCGDFVRDDGEQCDGPTPFCLNCRVVCGNGFLEQNFGNITEECDHGILNSNFRPNACRENCVQAFCGDGIVDTAGQCFEECDEGRNVASGRFNALLPNRCRPNCRLPICGDGIVDAGEECDDGNQRCGDGCTSTCKRECGNGRIDPAEACDDGAANSNTAGGCCRTNCQLPRCGDGITDPGEECDDGPLNKDGPNSCRMNCKLPTCGDGIADFLWDEKCDMGTSNSETAVDGCSPRCTPNQCGQSINPDIMVNPGDIIPSAPGVYCYDGSESHPPCTENVQWFVFAAPQTINTCQLNHIKRVLNQENIRPVQKLHGRTVSFLTEETRCGDGLVEGNEECDDGPKNSDFAANACRRNCRKARCGDGVQDAGEQCDGTPNCAANCRLSCPSASSCPNCNATSTSSGDSNVINVNFAGVSA